MKLISMYQDNSSQINNYAVFGFYYRNGVFDELDTNHGISYILDHVIYCMLSNIIADSGDVRVRCFTNYGHSEILIICAPDKVSENIRKAKEIIFREKLDFSEDTIQQWICYKTTSIQKKQQPADVLYYSHRAPASPLAKTISAGLNAVPTQEQLEFWRTKYMNEACVSVFVSGNVPQALASGYTNYPPGSLLPQIHVSKLILPKHIPWRHSQILYAVPCDINASNFLATEAFCQWMNPILSAEIRKNGGHFQSSLIHPDFFQEWQIRFQCPKGTEKVFTEQIIPQALRTTQITSESRINSTRRKVKMYYHLMSHDPVAWNRFAGYNAISGGRLCLDGLLSEDTYEEYITSEKIGEFLLEIQNQSDVSVFATAVR